MRPDWFNLSLRYSILLSKAFYKSACIYHIKKKWITILLKKRSLKIEGVQLKTEERRRHCGRIQTPINRASSRSAAITFIILISYFRKVGGILTKGSHRGDTLCNWRGRKTLKYRVKMIWNTSGVVRKLADWTVLLG